MKWGKRGLFAYRLSVRKKVGLCLFYIVVVSGWIIIEDHRLVGISRCLHVGCRLSHCRLLYDIKISDVQQDVSLTESYRVLLLNSRSLTPCTFSQLPFPGNYTHHKIVRLVNSRNFSRSEITYA